jgi:hypothetical protein
MFDSAFQVSVQRIRSVLCGFMGSSKLFRSVLCCKGRPISADVGFCGVLSSMLALRDYIRPFTEFDRVSHTYLM